VDALLNTAPCGFLSFSEDGTVLAANATLAEWLGYAPEALNGRHLETLLPVASRIFYQTHFFPLLKLTGRVDEVYFSVRTAEGGDLPVLVNAVRRERSATFVYDCILMVVRQRSQYEDEILTAKRAAEEARLWLSTTLRSIGDAVIATDAEGRVTFLNPIAEELTGWTQQQALASPLDEVFVIVNEETLLPVENPVTKVLREKRVVGLANHTLLIARDGTPYPIDDSAAPIRDSKGHILGVVLVFRDVTERRQAERELQQQQARIQTLNEHLQRAMTETHHRVKNNLQVISALVDMQIGAGLDTIASSELVRLSQHISGLAVIHDLLTHQTKKGGESEKLSVQETLDKLFPLLQGITFGRKLKVEVEDVLLPIRQATSLAVLANELVSNATKHGRGDISIAFSVTENQGLFEVWDQGLGFPPDFNPRVSANTGVDLVEGLSRHDLQGEVSYGNRPEGGASIVVRFPLQDRSE
jgi:PAS domain S-box-containing protein